MDLPSKETKKFESTAAFFSFFSKPDIALHSAAIDLAH
jgi:hypothetical protein